MFKFDKRKIFILICFIIFSNHKHIHAQMGKENQLELDHIFIWVNKEAPEMEVLKEKGFTSIISGSHTEQGTSGKYIFFLNFYIELLYISDTAEALGNIEKFGNDYIERSNWKQNHSSPFGIGLKMKPFKKSKIPFDYVEYHAQWMRGKALIMAKNNVHTQDPMFFILPPPMVFPCYETIDQMMEDDKPEDFKENHIHDNGIKGLTSYKIVVASDVNSSEFISSLKANGIVIEKGTENKIELVFDHAKQQKEMDLRPDLPLIIKY